MKFFISSLHWELCYRSRQDTISLDHGSSPWTPVCVFPSLQMEVHNEGSFQKRNKKVIENFQLKKVDIFYLKLRIFYDWKKNVVKGVGGRRKENSMNFLRNIFLKHSLMFTIIEWCMMCSGGVWRLLVWSRSAGGCQGRSLDCEVCRILSHKLRLSLYCVFLVCPSKLRDVSLIGCIYISWAVFVDNIIFIFLTMLEETCLHVCTKYSLSLKTETFQQLQNFYLTLENYEYWILGTQGSMSSW